MSSAKANAGPTRLERLLLLVENGSTMATRQAAAAQIGAVAQNHRQELPCIVDKVRALLRSKTWETRTAAAAAIGAIAENAPHVTVDEAEWCLARMQRAAIKREAGGEAQQGAGGGAGVKVEDPADAAALLLSPATVTQAGMAPGPAPALSLENFDLRCILEHGAPLLASGGEEYNAVPLKNTPEALALARKKLWKRLGLGTLEGGDFMDTSDVIRDEDLIGVVVTDGGATSEARGDASTDAVGGAGGPSGGIGAKGSGSGPPVKASELFANLTDTSQLSARERNRLKRKAKALTKDGEGDREGWPMGRGSAQRPTPASASAKGSSVPCASAEGAQASKKSRAGGEGAGGAQPGDPAGASEPVASPDGAVEEESAANDGEWPFLELCDSLWDDLFNSEWQVRHGAGMALREVLRSHGACAAVKAPTASQADVRRNGEVASSPMPPMVGAALAYDSKGTLVDVKAEGAEDKPLPVCAVPGDGLAGDAPSLALLPHVSSSSAREAHRAWLVECALRLVSVFALDRFCDFVSDQVVAPVRETCAQALGTVVRHLALPDVASILQLLRTLQSQGQWEVRHGGLLGLKYLVAVRGDLAPQLLPHILPAVLQGLRDADDDNRAVAAEALLPCAAAVAVGAPRAQLWELLATLWDILRDLDELSPSTRGVMNLLAELYAQPAVVSTMNLMLATVGQAEVKQEDSAEDELTNGNPALDVQAGGGTPDLWGTRARHGKGGLSLGALVPLLWPFAVHNNAGVRQAALRTVERLLMLATDTRDTGTGGVKQEVAPGGALGSLGWLLPILEDTLRHLVAVVVVEKLNSIRHIALRVWQLLLEVCPTQHLQPLAQKFTPQWLDLAALASGATVDASAVMLSSGRRQEEPAEGTRVVVEAAASTGPPGRRGKNKATAGKQQASRAPQQLPSQRFIVVGGEGEGALLNMRVTLCVAVGDLLRVCVQAGGEGEAERSATLALMAPLWAILASDLGRNRQVASMVLSELVAPGSLCGLLLDDPTAPAKSHASKLDATTQGQKKDASLPLHIAELLSSQILDQLQVFLAAADPTKPTPTSSGYSELVPLYEKLRREAQAYLAHACAGGLIAVPGTPVGGNNVADGGAGRENELLQSLGLPPVSSFGVQEAVALARIGGDRARQLAGQLAEAQLSSAPWQVALGAGQRLLATAGYLQTIQMNLHTSVLATVAGCAAALSGLHGRKPPEKLNPLVQPLIGAIRREKNVLLQRIAAKELAQLIAVCCSGGPKKTAAVNKIVKSLCTMLSAAQAEVLARKGAPAEATGGELANATSLVERLAGDEGAVTGLLDEGIPNAKGGVAGASGGSQEGAEVELAAAVTVRGAEAFFRSLGSSFGGRVLEELPKLWETMSAPLLAVGAESAPGGEAATLANADAPAPLVEGSVPSACGNSMPPQEEALLEALQVLGKVGPILDPSLRDRLLSLLPHVFHCLKQPHAGLRDAAARCTASLAVAEPQHVLALFLHQALPLLADMRSSSTRRGVARAVSLLVSSLGHAVVPYAVLLLVPLLGRMSDPDKGVRETVTQCFAELVPLLPLARGMPLPDGLDESLRQHNASDGRFLEQLLDNKKVDDYALPVRINGELRRYQQEGINWLAFLKRFGLHGILCDDMGLGKTLQATAIVAADKVEREEFNKGAPLPSLVVCPPTLVANWEHEVFKFCGHVLRPVMYMGPPAARAHLQKQIANANYDVVITSYEVVRKDVAELAAIAWNYLILDEGHIIKNAKAKITQAVKQLTARHRLLLSGTPIQNNVLELWSLFDFLMPGFLGSEQQFYATYGRALQVARNAKGGATAPSEKGVLALDALHRQVMPFLLRRTKDEVLSDLPPKILQDIMCELSPLQLRLYEDFASSNARHQLDEMVGALAGEREDATPDVEQAPAHVFQALQYLRKLCSHPLLVLDPSQRKHREALAAEGGDVAKRSLHHAPKLVALQQLLHNCGIGLPEEDSGGPALVPEGGSSGQHRVLIFAQMKAFLDIIETDLFLAHMPSVSYLRLDGGVEASKRFDVVRRFNSDPTIDVLLLTTHALWQSLLSAHSSLP
eukprot:jgi/Mesvir1/21274/Mv21673-RA.3